VISFDDVMQEELLAYKQSLLDAGFVETQESEDLSDSLGEDVTLITLNKGSTTVTLSHVGVSMDVTVRE